MMNKKISPYRKDGRSDEEFAKQIEESSLLENLLMRLYVNHLSKQKGENYSVIATGCGPDGQLLDEKHVTSKCDFALVTPRGEIRNIDIKFSKPDLKTFHLKVAHVKSYVEQNTCVVMFMGISGDKIRYTVIKPKDLAILMTSGKRVVLWGKDQIRCHIDDFKWQKV